MRIFGDLDYSVTAEGASMGLSRPAAGSRTISATTSSRCTDVERLALARIEQAGAVVSRGTYRTRLDRRPPSATDLCPIGVGQVRRLGNRPIKALDEESRISCQAVAKMPSGASRRPTVPPRISRQPGTRRVLDRAIDAIKRKPRRPSSCPLPALWERSCRF